MSLLSASDPAVPAAPPPTLASHSFFVQSGFLIDGAPGTPEAPYREGFMMVDAAAHDCSLEPRCRGFTLSAAHMQDDRLHFVRFFSHTNVALSAEWITHTKEPMQAFAYHFSPGYLLPQLPRGSRSLESAREVDVARPQLTPLLQVYTTLYDAQRYCDAEPDCAGFTLRRHPSESAAAEQEAPSNHDNQAAAAASHFAYITFAGLDESATDDRYTGFMSVYDDDHVSYLRGAALATGVNTHSAADLRGAGGSESAIGRAAAPQQPRVRYRLQLGFLGATAHPMHEARMSLNDGYAWCSAQRACGGAR